MLACISSAESNVLETLGTLQYAARTKSIQNKVVANISTNANMHVLLDNHDDFENTLINQLRERIISMEQQLQKNNYEKNNKVDGNNNNNSQLSNKQIEKIFRTISELKKSIKSVFSEISSKNDYDLVIKTFQHIFSILTEIESFNSSNDKMIRQSLTTSLLALNATVSNNIKFNFEEENKLLREELEECREDLKRDEGTSCYNNNY